MAESGKPEVAKPVRAAGQPQQMQGRPKRVKPPRRDPKPRMIDTSQTTNTLVNKEPGVSYLFCPNGPLMQQYEMRGYKVVHFKRDGVRPRGALNLKEGEAICIEGAYLLQIKNEDLAQIEEYGADNASGQDILDELDKQILDENTFARDELRGIQGVLHGVIGVENQSTQAGAG